MRIHQTVKILYLQNFARILPKILELQFAGNLIRTINFPMIIIILICGERESVPKKMFPWSAMPEKNLMRESVMTLR